MSLDSTEPSRRDSWRAQIVAWWDELSSIPWRQMAGVLYRRFREARSLTAQLALLAILLPLLNAGAGLLMALLIGLTGGTAAAFVILCASASYIAVPAAMRLALPNADAGLYLAMSLAITFPFNIILGIPLYAWAVHILG